MEKKTQIFMPLRSNAAWFGDADCQLRLERQFKTFLVLYDQIVLENGRYRVIAGAHGQGMQMMFPGNSFPGDRTKVSFVGPGRAFEVALAGKRVMQSTSQVSYEVDFYPLVRSAGLERADFIAWSDHEIKPEFKTAIEKRALDDLLSKNLDDVLPDNRYLRRHVLEGLYRDSLLAHFLKSAFCVDFHSAPIISKQRKEARRKWAPEVPVAFFDYWLNIDLPDFASLPWDSLCEFRQSDVGVSFREMVRRVSRRVKDILPDVENQQDLDDWLGREFNKELLAELANRLTTATGTITSICLNIIPYGFIPSIIKDVKALSDDEASWVSLVRGYDSRN